MASSFGLPSLAFAGLSLPATLRMTTKDACPLSVMRIPKLGKAASHIIVRVPAGAAFSALRARSVNAFFMGAPEFLSPNRVGATVGQQRMGVNGNYRML